jgi:hypothetical protein
MPLKGPLRANKRVPPSHVLFGPASRRPVAGRAGSLPAHFDSVLSAAAPRFSLGPIRARAGRRAGYRVMDTEMKGQQAAAGFDGIGENRQMAAL